MHLSHEVTPGDSYGREPVEQPSTVVFSPEGMTGNDTKKDTYRLFETFRQTCCKLRGLCSWLLITVSS